MRGEETCRRSGPGRGRKYAVRAGLQSPEERLPIFVRASVCLCAQLMASARSVAEMREVLRSSLVRCMKAGDTLLLRLKVCVGGRRGVRGEEWAQGKGGREGARHGAHCCCTSR